MCDSEELPTPVASPSSSARHQDHADEEDGVEGEHDEHEGAPEEDDAEADLLSRCLRLIADGDDTPMQDGTLQEAVAEAAGEGANVEEAGQEVEEQRQQVLQEQPLVQCGIPPGMVLAPMQPPPQPLFLQPQIVQFQHPGMLIMQQIVPVVPQVIYQAPTAAVPPPPAPPPPRRPPEALHPVPIAPSGGGRSDQQPPSSEKPSDEPKCQECGKTFSSRHALKLHTEEIHNGGRGCFTCAECGQVYSRLRSLERHHIKVHRELQDMPRCEECGKKVVNVALHFRKFHCRTVSVQAGGGKGKRKGKAKRRTEIKIP